MAALLSIPQRWVGCGQRVVLGVDSVADSAVVVAKRVCAARFAQRAILRDPQRYQPASAGRVQVAIGRVPGKPADV
eukprot:scaffold8986_cov81-Phaeocystis_antarctica.AAC.1